MAAQAEPREPQRLFIVVPQELQSELASIVDAVESQLVDTEVAVWTVPIPTAPASLEEQVIAARALAKHESCLAVLWCEWQATRITLYSMEAGQERILVREIAEPEARSRAEAISIIVRASVTALLLGQHVGVEARAALAEERASEDAKEQATAAAIHDALPQPRALEYDTAKETPSVSWQVEAAYSLVAHSAQFPALSGLAVGFSAKFAAHGLVFVQYLIEQPLLTRGQTSTLEVWRHPVGLGLGWSWGFPKLELDLRAAVLADFATYASFDAAAGYEGVGEGMDVLLSLVPSVRLSYAALHRVHLFVSLGAEIPLKRLEFEEMTRTGPRTVLASWPALPLFQAGVAVLLH
ncbi:MAG: hypothetical protein MUC50_21940 [Myxococcota bacterium]|nr:hypothetical protein [Myxococcota bacterium]